MLALLAAAPVGSAVPAPPTAEQAPIALMIDLSSGQTLYSREADRRFIPASITKVMTVFLAFEMMEQGRLHPRQVFTMSDRIYDDWYRTGSTMFLDRDSTATVEELLMGITTVSANDGAAMLAEGAAGSLDRWIAMMNTKAREVGMALVRPSVMAGAWSW
jgi:D-alanyl-D-alanine carboxypeptidase (penicillin-binding protein 5/6)